MDDNDYRVNNLMISRDNSLMTETMTSSYNAICRMIEQSLDDSNSDQRFPVVSAQIHNGTQPTHLIDLFIHFNHLLPSGGSLMTTKCFCFVYNSLFV